MTNKDVRKYLACKKGNEIIIWSWNNPRGAQLQTRLWKRSGWKMQGVLSFLVGPNLDVGGQRSCIISYARPDQGGNILYQCQNQR